MKKIIVLVVMVLVAFSVFAQPKLRSEKLFEFSMNDVPIFEGYWATEALLDQGQTRIYLFDVNQQYIAIFITSTTTGKSVMMLQDVKANKTVYQGGAAMFNVMDCVVISFLGTDYKTSFTVR